MRSSLVQRGYWPFVIALFVIAAALRAPTFTHPWIGGHKAWGGAFYGNVGRNFVRYGFATTDFAPVVNTGRAEPSQFEVYYHHPVLSMWLTGASFKAFGVHEWSARLAPLLFSLLTAALVLHLARKLFDNGTAVVALGFFSVLPVDGYYATHLDPYGSMAIFLTVLAVECYRRWLLSGSNQDLVFIGMSIVLGCLTSWYTYFIVPPIVVHWWFTQRRSAPLGTWVKLAVLPACAVLVFAFFVLHRHIALSDTRPEVFGAISGRFLMRTVELPLGRAEILKAYLTHIWELYTAPFVVLAAAWLVMFLRDLIRKQVASGDWFVAIVLSYGFLYALAFPGHLPAHDYFARAYAPGVALASASVVMRSMRLVSSPGVRLALAVGVVTIVSALAIQRTRSLFASENRAFGYDLRELGNAVATLIPPTQPVLLPTRDDKVLAYYVDRPVSFDIDTRAKLDSAAATIRGPYLIVLRDRAVARFPALVEHLRATYSERRQGSFLIFPSQPSAARVGP